jgi:PhnB protein
MAKATRAVPEGHHTVTPSLTLDDSARAIAWYKEALGAEEVARVAGPDGKIMHAEIRIGDSLIMIMDPMMGAKGPKAFDDCDALFERALAAGGEVVEYGEMRDQFWGDRSGTFADPHGYMWTIATHKEDLTPDEMKQRQDEFMRELATKS